MAVVACPAPEGLALYIVRCGIFPGGLGIKLSQRILDIKIEKARVGGRPSQQYPFFRAVLTLQRVEPNFKCHFCSGVYEISEPLAVFSDVADGTIVIFLVMTDLTLDFIAMNGVLLNIIIDFIQRMACYATRQVGCIITVMKIPIRIAV